MLASARSSAWSSALLGGPVALAGACWRWSSSVALLGVRPAQRRQAAARRARPQDRAGGAGRQARPRAGARSPHARRPGQARRRGLDGRAVRRGRRASRPAKRRGGRDQGRHGRRLPRHRARALTHGHVQTRGGRHGRGLIILLACRLLRGPRAGQDGPDRAAGARRHRRAVRQVPRPRCRRPEHRDAVRRPGPLHDRPARAGRVVPAAAGDHRGQPGGLDRHRHLLPGDQPGRRRRTRSPTTSRRSSSSP